MYTLVFTCLLVGVASFLFTRSTLRAVFFWKEVAATARRYPFRNIVLRFLDAYPAPASFFRLMVTQHFRNIYLTSGLAFYWTEKRLVSIKYWILLLVLALQIVYAGMFGITKEVLLWCVLLLVMTFVCFDIFLVKKSKARCVRATKEFGFIMDLLRLQVSAGFNLEHAVMRVAENRTDFWGREFKFLAGRIKLGQSLEQALVSFAGRFNSLEIKHFTMAVRQAKSLGVSVAETLRIQSHALRTSRRQRAEEKARLASVKIAIPLVLLIFPALLIVYLAPVLMQFLGPS